MNNLTHHIFQSFKSSFPQIKFSYSLTKEIEQIINSLKSKNSYGYDWPKLKFREYGPIESFWNKGRSIWLRMCSKTQVNSGNSLSGCWSRMETKFERSVSFGQFKYKFSIRNCHITISVQGQWLHPLMYYKSE